MKTFMDGGIKVSVDSTYNLRWLSFAKQKLIGLDQARELSGVPSLAQKHIPENGIIVHVRVSEDSKEIEIIREPVDGFLFHPRSGEIDWKAHTFWVGLSFRTVQFPYIKGAGWKPNGELLPGTPVEYPLADGDKGTRNVRRRWSGERKWKYIKNPPENYGNLDWKGWNTAGPGSRPDNPVLTWKGPPSRYFAEGMEFQATGEPYYTPNIYESGRLLVSVPVSEEPYTYGGLDEPVPYVVMGAALTKDADDDMWLIVVAREYFTDLLTGGTRNSLRVAARKYKSLDDKLNDWYNEETNPEGWRILLDGGKFPAASPWHFNASGTEASSVHEWVIRTISVNINTLSAEMVEVAAAENITGTGHQEGTGLMTGTYNGWDGAVYSADGGLVDPYSGIWIDSSNNNVGSCRYYQGGYGVRSECVEAICAVDYKGDIKVEARLAYVSDSKKETALVQEISATATTLPGTSLPTKGTQHGKLRSGTVITYDCQVQLSFGNIATDVYSESIRAHNGTKGELKYTIVEWYGNDPSKLSGTLWSMTLNDEERDIRAGAVMFLDLRHDIAVIAKRRIYSNVTNHTNQHFYNYDTAEDLYPDNESTATVDYETTMNIVGQGDDELPWYEQFVFTDDDENVTMQYPAWASITDISTDYPVTSIHFRYSNQPVGSWAVDRQGNHFYSMLVKDGVYNYLTGGEPVTLTETEGDNPVFFPIAPV